MNEKYILMKFLLNKLYDEKLISQEILKETEKRITISMVPESETKIAA